MSVETSSAPREIGIVYGPAGSVTGPAVYPDGRVELESLAASLREEHGDGYRAAGYVRRDLVVPTVDEMNAWATERFPAWNEGPAPVELRAFREFLLSRIEGDDDHAA